MKAVVLVVDEEHADSIAALIAAALRLNRFVTNEPSVIDWPELSDVDAPLEGARHRNAGSTERAAALAVMPRSGTQRRRVLEAIARAESVDERRDGLTDYEVAEKTSLYLYSAAPRRTELVVGGWVHDSGRRRRTPRGQEAVVWTLTPAGRERLYGTPGHQEQLGFASV